MRGGDRARRMLTDWTSTAGVGGEGLLALVHGPVVTPDAIHLGTLGFEVLVLGPGTDSARVHHVDVTPGDVPDVWHRRFDLVVTLDAAAVPALTPVVAAGGVLVVITEVGRDVHLGELTEVLREQGADPDEPSVERYRLVATRIGLT